MRRCRSLSVEGEFHIMRAPCHRRCKTSEFLILLAKSLPGLCPHVEQGDDGASSRVQNDFANNIKNSDVLHLAHPGPLPWHMVAPSWARTLAHSGPLVGGTDARAGAGPMTDPASAYPLAPEARRCVPPLVVSC